MTAPTSGAWWRLLVGLVLAALGLLAAAVLALEAVVVAAHLLGFGHFSVSTDTIDAGTLLGTNLGLALLVPLATALTALLYGVPPAWLVSLRPGLRWRWLGVCAGAACVVWSLFLVLGTIGAYVGRSAPLDSGVVGFIVVVCLTTPLQAAGEEFLFRGFVLQSLGATRLPGWVCCLASGALFATAHGQFAPPLFADRLLIGVVLGWLAIATGGLEAGIAIHAVKNISVLIPAALLDQVSGAVDPSDVSWLPFGLDLVLLAIVSAWLLRLARRRLPAVAPDVVSP